MSDRLAPGSPVDDKHRRRMLVALILLLLALGVVLVRQFGNLSQDVEEAGDDVSSEVSTPTTATQPNAVPRTGMKHHSSAVAAKAEVKAAPQITTSERTVLPPLEVEVVAGDQHRTIRSSDSAVKVDLRPGSPVVASEPSIEREPAPLGGVSNAGERARLSSRSLSSDTTGLVTRKVQPSYPLLARQMKVQGSVVLQALIGKDGVIQDLQVVSGPNILSEAAREAVQQWRFKPYFQGGQAVDTQARITVNFTISAT